MGTYFPGRIDRNTQNGDVNNCVTTGNSYIYLSTFLHNSLESGEFSKVAVNMLFVRFLLNKNQCLAMHY